MKKFYIVVIIFILMFTFNFVLASDVNDAKRYYNKGKKELAMEMLKDITGINDKNNHYAWYVLGNYYLDSNNYRQALNCFTQAVIIKPNKYDNDIVAILKKTGAKCLSDVSRNGILSSAYLFSKALKFLPKENQQKFKNEIAELCLNKGENLLKVSNFKRADPLFAMVCKYNPSLEADLCNLIMDYGDIADDYACVKYYVYAKTFCGENQRRIKAGKRLEAIADKLEVKNLFDPRIEKYRKFAGQFIDLPPSTITYKPGDNLPFELEEGEYFPNHWIHPKREIKYTFFKTSGKFEVHFRGGLKIKICEGEKIPFNFNEDFKIYATEPCLGRVEFSSI